MSLAAMSTTGKPSGPCLSASFTPPPPTGCSCGAPRLLDLLGEGARAARERLDVEDDVSILAVPSGLLLVPAALDDRLLDGLAIADRRLVRGGGDAKAIRQALGGDPQLHLALSPQHDLMRLGVVHDADRRILLSSLLMARA